MRRQLEDFHGAPNASAVATVWPHLNHADRHIRYAARLALEHQPLSAWKDKALSEIGAAVKKDLVTSEDAVEDTAEGVEREML